MTFPSPKRRSRVLANARIWKLTAVLLTAGLPITGCTDPEPALAISEPDPELAFVRGYRSDGDPCQLTGETAFTVDFLDDAADLVTCPTGDPAADALVAATGATVVTQTNSFTLYTVPRR